MSHHLNTTMGVTLCASGAYAYYKKRSLPSLIACSVFASAYFGSAYLIKTNKDPQLGHDIAAITSGLLAVTMGSRVLKTKSFKEPLNIATVMTVTGLLVGGYNVKKSLMYREPAELDIDEAELAQSIGIKQ